MAKVGDIFVVIWGYDQTNATFFQVVKVSNKSVSVKQVKNRKTDENKQAMTGYESPIKNSFYGNAMTKRIQSNYHGEEAIRTEFGLAHKWNGQPIGVSYYG